MTKDKPWIGYVKPGRIFGNLYFVGTRPASTHIIDTGEGLIMIDPGYHDSLYLVIQNMWELGLNPKDIKYLKYGINFLIPPFNKNHIKGVW